MAINSYNWAYFMISHLRYRTYVIPLITVSWAITALTYCVLICHWEIDVGKSPCPKSPCYQWVNPRTKWAMFNSYVSLPEGNSIQYIYIHNPINNVHKLMVFLVLTNKNRGFTNNNRLLT